MRNYKKEYQAGALFPNLARLMAIPPGAEETVDESRLRTFIMNHIRRTGPMLKSGLANLPEHLRSLFQSTAKTVSPLLDRAVTLAAELTRSEQETFTIVPAVVLDLMVGILVGYLLELDEIGQKETDRLVTGLGGGRPKDAERAEILDWARERRNNVPDDDMKKQFLAVLKECSRRNFKCPWKDPESVKRALAAHRKDLGGEAGRRGRPKKSSK